MFLDKIKSFFVKKTFKKSLFNVETSELNVAVKTVGLLIDASHFSEKEALIQELIVNGISENNIKVVAYKDKNKESVTHSYSAFSDKHLNWKGEITDSSVNDFINEKFDMLISYYDVERAILMVITHNSKAQFKVGFSSIDKRLNHLMINTNVSDYRVFTNELFKYLKLLNKI